MRQTSQGWRDGFRFSQSLQMIGLVTVLLLVCMTLVRVYSGCVTTSRQARQLNDSVVISRSIAECYTATGSLEATALQFGVQSRENEADLWFDQSLNASDADEGCYNVRLSETAEDTGAGQLRQCAIEVSADGAALYQLSVSVYCPVEEPQS